MAPKAVEAKPEQKKTQWQKAMMWKKVLEKVLLYNKFRHKESFIFFKLKINNEQYKEQLCDTKWAGDRIRYQ